LKATKPTAPRRANIINQRKKVPAPPLPVSSSPGSPGTSVGLTGSGTTLG